MSTMEEKLSRLETLGKNIQDRDVSLEQAMQFFEEGMALSKSLEKELLKFEQRVEILSREPGSEDEPEYTAFPPTSEGKESE